MPDMYRMGRDVNCSEDKFFVVDFVWYFVVTVSFFPLTVLQTEAWLGKERQKL